MAGNGSRSSQNGLDPAVSNQLLLSQNAHTQSVLSQTMAMHKESMSAMKDAMAQLAAAQKSSEEKFMQVVSSMQHQHSDAILGLNKTVQSLMDILAPAMLNRPNQSLGFSWSPDTSLTRPTLNAETCQPCTANAKVRRFSDSKPTVGYPEEMTSVLPLGRVHIQ